MYNKVELGRAGEELVLQQYLRQGYALVTKNFQYYRLGMQGRQGEIDLILAKDKVLVLVEVKTRTSLKFGQVAEQITQKQLLNLQRAYQAFLFKFPAYRNCNARFDAAIVLGDKVEVIENAVWF
jgi:putative endonuclease